MKPLNASLEKRLIVIADGESLFFCAYCWVVFSCFSKHIGWRYAWTTVDRFSVLISCPGAVLGIAAADDDLSISCPKEFLSPHVL